MVMEGDCTDILSGVTGLAGGGPAGRRTQLSGMSHLGVNM
jgi:hypothetical protein